MKNRAKAILGILGIIIIALFFRATGLNWDQGHHLHPDERFIIMTVENIAWPDKLNPHFFAYGSLPLYILKIVSSIGGLVYPLLGTYGKMHLVGRIISTIFDIGTLCLIYGIIKNFSKKRTTALFGSLWYACSVLPIQLSHFFAVDTMLTFFIVLTLYLLLQYHKKPSPLYAIAIGVASGMAVATKFSGIMVAIPIGITLVYRIRSQWKERWIHAIYMLIAGLSTFICCQPYALLDFATFSRQIIEQQAMTKSAFTFPYTLQYVGKIPYVYEITNIFLWGQGPFLATLSFVGVGVCTYTLIVKKNYALGILLSFFWVYFGVVGKFAIGFMRYLLPIYPILTICAAVLMEKITQKISQAQSAIVWVWLTIGLLLWTSAFMHIYTKPNTRTQATNWILANIPNGTPIALEHWDDGLPLTSASSYDIKELPLYDGDTQEKWKKIYTVLNQTEYIIIASNRLYVPLMKMTDCTRLPVGRCYKTTASYYQRLFDGSLGFQKVAEFSTMPTIPILNIPIDDSGADESFTVYDHPKVMIFQKTPSYRSLP